MDTENLFQSIQANKKMLKKSLPNLTLRGLVLLSKFLFSIFILKTISVESFGEYSLFVTTVTLGGFLFSWDYYQYVLRKYVNTTLEEEKYALLAYQFFFHFSGFIILLPIFLFTTQIGLISSENLFIFYFILLFDNLSQELFRSLITARRSLLGNLILFIRSASWILIIILISFTSYSYLIDLELILYSWLTGAVISVFLGFIFLKLNPFQIITIPKKFKNIKLALKTSSLFFFGTISFKLFETSGRIISGIYFSTFEVGIFTFYFTIANLLYLIPQAGLFQVISPDLIRQLTISNIEEKKRIILNFSKTLVALVLIIVITITSLFDVLLDFIGNTSLVAYKHFIYYLLAGVSFFTLSYIPHYWLFSLNRDKEIMKSMVIGSFSGVICVISLIPTLGFFGIIIGVSTGFISIFALKLIYALKAN